MTTAHYLERRGELEIYFDRTAVAASRRRAGSRHVLSH